MNRPRYTVIIQWSDEDQVYVVSLPEWGSSCKTHGMTYKEAAANAEQVLELLIENHEANQGMLPAPKLFNFPGADVVDLDSSKVASSVQHA